MKKYLDESGVRYLWNRILDKINSIEDLFTKTPKIRIIGDGKFISHVGSYPKYYVENGQKYIDQGYIPMLFTRRSVRKSYRSGSKLNGNVILDNKTYVSTRAEWRRYSDIFVEVTPPDMGVGPDQLAFYRYLHTPLAFEKDRHFGAIFHHGEFQAHYDGECTTNLGAFLIPVVKLTPPDPNPDPSVYDPCFVAPIYYLYNGKKILSSFPDLRDMPDLTIFDNWKYLRQLHFDFKFCFVKNKWKWRGESYDPKVSIIRTDKLGQYYKDLYPKYHLYSRAKYTPDDAVSNIVDIKVHVYPYGGSYDVAYDKYYGYYTNYKVDILN